MLPSRAGCNEVCFPNNNHAREERIWIPICLFCANGGKQAVTILRSCIGNWWLVATPTRIAQCTSNSFACLPKDGKIPKLRLFFRVLLFWHDKRFFCFFVDRKNSRL